MRASLASVCKTPSSNPLMFNGFRVKQIKGAAPEGEGEGEGSENSDSAATGTEGSEGQGQENDQKNKETGDAADLAERLRRTEEKMRNADRRATEAEKKAKEYEDKDKSELERTTNRVKELEAREAAQGKEIRDLRLQNAFLSSNDISWHDPDLAVQHADLSEVLDEDGNVNKKALKKALESLKNEKPFLVKGDTEQDDGTQQQQRSGSTVGTQSTKTKKQLDEEALRKKYPSLV